MEKILRGDASDFLEIHEAAAMLHVHPTHLSNTIKETTGRSPCDLCNTRTIAAAKALLDRSDLAIADVAVKLTFEPTNFTKYFKRHTGMTPSAYRALVQQADR